MKPLSLRTFLTDAVGSGSGQGRGEPRRPRGRAISAPAQPGRRLRGREGKFLYVNGELASGPSGSRPLPRRARGPLPPLPNRLKPLLARAGGWGSRLGLRVAPGWERGAPPLGQKESLPDAAGALGRSPWTLPNGTPVFQLADFLQSLMLVSYGPTGCCGICTKDPGGRGMRRRLGLTQPGSWLAQKPKPSSTHPPPRPPAAFPFEPPPSRTGSRLLAFPYLSAFPNTILKHFCCLTREGG